MKKIKKTKSDRGASEKPVGTSIKDPVRYLDELIVVRISRLAEIVSRVATQNIEDRYAIRLTDMRILSLLHNSNKMSVAEISRRAHIDKAWISRLARELEQNGLLVRTPDPEDSRSMLLSLTRRGRDLQDSLLPESKKRESFLLQGLDRKRLVAQLTILERNLDLLLQNGGRVPDDLDL
jgi:DNA-binding MarR family transcriptional regulator